MPQDPALFRDFYRLVKPTKEEITQWKDSYNTFSAESKPGLEVTFEATHSALFNDNLRLYLPSRMRDGCKTFIARNKKAKILKHHDSSSDPVGVVVDAEYIDTIPEYLLENKDVQIMLDSESSLKNQVKAARRFLKSGIPFQEGWKGLGYIKLKGVVYDEKTIEQIQDGRFDAVSTSFRSPGHAYCSECVQNLVTDGFCEHSPGVKYLDGEEDDDGVVCGIIPGVHNYDEVSLVVFDGDPLTQIFMGHQDSSHEYTLSVKDWEQTPDEVQSNVVYSFRDFKEEVNMADPKAKEEKISDAELVEENQDETANQVINPDSICDEMQVELKNMLDEGLISEDEWKAADAKLSTEQRKKLSESTFCGPDRSFPVPDCAHVTAARRLIGRYEGPGDKEKILACVDRKAKALGCDNDDCAVPETQEENIDKFQVPSCSDVSTLSDEDAKHLFDMAESEMISRGLKLDRPCGKCAAHEDEAKKHEEALKDEQNKNKELTNQLSVLRDELRFQISDYMQQVDRYVELSAKLNGAQKDHLALVGTLSGKFENVDNAIEFLKDKDIKQESSVIMADFKVEDILNKLNDGMSREPVLDDGEQLDNPVVQSDSDLNPLPDGLSQQAIAAIENIREMIKDAELVSARAYYDKMLSLKVFDQNIVPFDSLSANKKIAAE